MEPRSKTERRIHLVGVGRRSSTAGLGNWVATGPVCCPLACCISSTLALKALTALKVRGTVERVAGKVAGVRGLRLGVSVIALLSGAYHVLSSDNLLVRGVLSVSGYRWLRLVCCLRAFLAFGQEDCFQRRSLAAGSVQEQVVYLELVGRSPPDPS